MSTLVTTVAIVLWLPGLTKLPIILWFVWLSQRVTSVPFSGRFLIYQNLSFALQLCTCKLNRRISSIIIIIIITLINVSFVTILLHVSYDCVNEKTLNTFDVILTVHLL